jgi:hypothetical protein
LPRHAERRDIPAYYFAVYAAAFITLLLRRLHYAGFATRFAITPPFIIAGFTTCRLHAGLHYAAILRLLLRRCVYYRAIIASDITAAYYHAITPPLIIAAYYVHIIAGLPHTPAIITAAIIAVSHYVHYGLPLLSHATYYRLLLRRLLLRRRLLRCLLLRPIRRFTRSLRRRLHATPFTTSTLRRRHYAITVATYAAYAVHIISGFIITPPAITPLRHTRRLISLAAAYYYAALLLRCHYVHYYALLFIIIAVSLRHHAFTLSPFYAAVERGSSERGSGERGSGERGSG